jgi:hypothetical protein
MAGEYISDSVFDSGLSYADTNGTRIDITSQVATTYSQATTAGTYSLGNKTGLNTGAPANAATGTGRRVTVPAITDGTVTNTGTATHWALTDGASILVATGPLSASQGVTAGNTFTLDAIDIIIRDATIT